MNIGVIGSGSIGPDLAYGFLSAIAKKGGVVFLHDIKQEALDLGQQRIHGYMQKALAKGKLSAAEVEAMKTQLKPTLDMKDLAGCAYVLEAATEDLRTKRLILSKLEEHVGAECLIGFATSGIPRHKICEGARHPDRCFVNHPFFPAWRALPIEVVLSGHEAYGRQMLTMLKNLGKVPIVTADVECFAADDIFVNYCAEAARIVSEGIATPAQVDKVVDEAIGGGGPFWVMDLTKGNLLNVHCLELMRDAKTGSAWFSPPAIFSKQGNTPWHASGKPERADCQPDIAQEIRDRILAVLLGRTYFVCDQRICEASELNWLTKNALGFAKGLLDLAADLGAAEVSRLCNAYAARNPGFCVPPTIAEGRLVSFYRNLVLERDGDISVVRVRRPEVRNALSALTIAELDAAIGTLLKDGSVKGIVLSSYDGALAGADIGELAALPTPEACEAICLNTYKVLDRISHAGKPIVAAVDGPVMGGGAEFCMACHARVVGSKLILAQPEVNLGIIPGYGGTQRLPRLIGLDKALDVLRTGRTLSAKEAFDLGWASQEPAVDPVSAAKALIQKHLSGATCLKAVNPAPLLVPEKLPQLDLGHHSLAIDAILVDVLRTGLRLPLSEGLLLEAKGFGRCKRTVDLDIGMRNFIQNGPRVPAAFLHE